jgi:hypothetical protein
MPRSDNNDFPDRFAALARNYRRTQAFRTLCVVLVGLLAALVAIIAADYFLELPRDVRAAVTIGSFFVAAATLAWRVQRASRKLTDDVVAAEVEVRFPELGQAVRTSVQLGRDESLAGASPALVAAMHRDVGKRAANLPLDEAVPSAQLRRALVLVAVAIAIPVVAAFASWEWRVATLRTLFGDQPYTQLAVQPGDTLVEEGAAVKLTVDVHGRVDRPMQLMTRPVADPNANWTTAAISDASLVRQATRHAQFLVELPDIRQPLEYRVAANPYTTATHRIRVRHPLAIKNIRIEIEPPSYTRLPTSTVHDGMLRAIAGSNANIEIETDRPAASAQLKLFPVPRSSAASDDQSATVPLDVNGRILSGRLELSRDMLYSVEGTAADGSPIRHNRYRVRIQDDRLPRIHFHEPDEETEVHSLAEVVLRAEVADEFGIRQAGIMVRVNNGSEYPLILHDASKGDKPATRLTLEKTLPLESLKLTQKDSLTYYAFAEDTGPGTYRRTQSDLRFVDIRPFRRRYRAPAGTGGEGFGGGQEQLASLEELVSRERYILNGTLRLARSRVANQSIDLREIDECITLQQETAELTRGLADAVAELEDSLDITQDRVSDLFFAANNSMLLAMDSLPVAEYETASLQETDAIRYLVEARNQIEIIIGQAGRGALSRFFRSTQLLMRRLRGAQGDAERIAEATRKLRELAIREDAVAKGLAAMQNEPVSTGGDPDLSDQSAERLARQLRELVDQQRDIGFEAEKVNDDVQKIASITELTRSRSSASVELAANVASALEGDGPTRAIEQAEDATSLFRELAQQLESVTNSEPAGRIAMARDMASRVAIELQRVRGELEKDMPPQQPASMKDQEAEGTTLGDRLSRRTRWMADAAATVEDVLNSIIANFASSQGDLVSQIERLITETELGQTDQRLERFEELVNGRNWEEAGLELEVSADRVDNLAQRLDGIHRSLVAPRIEQLRSYEQQAIDLENALQELSNQSQAVRWHEKVAALLRDAQAANVNLKTSVTLTSTMAAGGWQGGSSSTIAWPKGENEYLMPPDAITTEMHKLVLEIQRYIYELAIGGVQALDSGSAPPQYVDLVRRYMEIISYDETRISDPISRAKE